MFHDVLIKILHVLFIINDDVVFMRVVTSLGL